MATANQLISRADKASAAGGRAKEAGKYEKAKNHFMTAHYLYRDACSIFSAGLMYNKAMECCAEIDRRKATNGS